jgi:hypothetical protein
MPDTTSTRTSAAVARQVANAEDALTLRGLRPTAASIPFRDVAREVIIGPIPLIYLKKLNIYMVLYSFEWVD